jgi:hypothetical protein
MTKGGHDYLYVVVDKFSKMCILMHVKRRSLLSRFLISSFNMFGFTLDYPHPSSWIEILNSLGTFGLACGESWTPN